MRVDLYGLTIEAKGVTIYLRSLWRSTVLEQRLFDAVRHVPGAVAERHGDEQRIVLHDPRSWQAALHHMARVLKGWQEEASDSDREERRRWRWMLEADVDASGHDMHGEPACFWAYLRLSIDRGGVTEQEQTEDIDLYGLEICIWNRP